MTFKKTPKVKKNLNEQHYLLVLTLGAIIYYNITFSNIPFEVIKDETFLLIL